MELSVIIVNYNAREHLENCLESLFENTRLRPIEVWVVDNASSDGSVEMLKERFPQVQVIESNENLGFGAANNEAMRRAKGRYKLLLNNDTIVHPDAIDTMVRIMSERPRVGVLGPLLRNEDGTVQISYGDRVSFFSELSQKRLSARYQAGHLKTQRHIESRSREESHPDWVTGACMMLQAELPQEVRFFDENFFMYLEDVDLCERIRQKGFQVLYSPEAELTHLRGKSVEAHSERVALEYRRSQLYFYSKHYGRTAVRILKVYLLSKGALDWLLGGPTQRPYSRRFLELVWKY
jgi:GT2 family glycosyltransferase